MDGLGIICVEEVDDGIFAGRRCSVEESDSTISQLPSTLSDAACTYDFR